MKFKRFIKELDKDLQDRWINFYKLMKQEPLLGLGLSMRKISIKHAISGNYDIENEEATTQ